LIFSKLEVFHKVVGSVPLGFEVAFQDVTFKMFMILLKWKK
jgi:hypothetical protein